MSMTINKYIYIALSDKFDHMTRVSYSRTENVRHPTELQHDLARECLKLTDVQGVEVTSVSDIPGEGTGLGSSSAYTVGLLAALSKRAGKLWPAEQLAQTAYVIEHRICSKPGVGKQDHYSAAYGGFRFYQFNQNNSVDVLKMPIMPSGQSYLQDNLILLYTDVRRDGNPILTDQELNLRNNRASIQSAIQIRDLALRMAKDFSERKFYKTGDYLQKGWELKKHLSSKISNPDLDDLYYKAIRAGAFGGKLLGAGGGGFFLFFAPSNCHEKIVKGTGLRQVEFKMETEGAKIIYDSNCQT